MLNLLRYVGNGPWPVTNIISGLCHGVGVVLTFGKTLVIGLFIFAETSVTANIYLHILQSYAILQCSIYNPLISANKMMGHGCSSILPELDYRQDILRVTKGIHLEVH
ncbi:hypothetical protein AVEN_254491-1 [Araneus ventricosus]|uniref:Uncharacterized protein n=1 Tax=Araneus ventricosus TaxID=182803 RepID=A0A4Y2LT46_ARAVE|nr:hypothetical protein AVEN_254491-1 [Araneus ventricosus]